MHSASRHSRSLSIATVPRLLPCVAVCVCVCVCMCSSPMSAPLSVAGTGASGVGGLVDSIRQHKNFKRLVCFAIQCLEKVRARARVRAILMNAFVGVRVCPCTGEYWAMAE